MIWMDIGGLVCAILASAVLGIAIFMFGFELKKIMGGMKKMSEHVIRSPKQQFKVDVAMILQGDATIEGKLYAILGALQEYERAQDKLKRQSEVKQK